ncbi:hypothetical protein [Streptococcus pantholopis]|nr:hypothetical protein [Streptococcus pantholopis]
MMLGIMLAAIFFPQRLGRVQLLNRYRAFIIPKNHTHSVTFS